MNYAEIALQYCYDVLNDNLPNRKACKLEKLSCQRHLNNLAQQDDPEYPYYCDDKAGIRHVKFLSKLRHSKGKWRNQLFVPEPHQIFYHFCLFAWKKKSTGFRRFNKAYLKIPRKNGKAISLDTLIPTPEGWTTQGDLKIGDSVFDELGNVCNVTDVTEIMNERPCYKLVFSNGQEVIADEEHEWLTTARVNMPGERKEKKIRRFREPKLVKARCGSKTKQYWYANLYGRQEYIGCCENISESQALAKLSELAKDDLLKHPFNVDNITRIRTTGEIFKSLTYGARHDLNHSMLMPKPLVCKEVELPISPYLFGSWLGDGNSHEFTISCGEQDVESFKGEILKEGFCFTQRRDRTAWRLFVRTLINGEIVTDLNDSRSLNYILKQLNVYKNKHIPEIYLRSSFEQRLALLQGLMDTDGTVDSKGKVFQFVTILKDFAEDFCELVSSMGIKYSLIEKKMRCNGVDVKGTCYSIQFNVFRCELPVFRLQRKLDRMRELADTNIAPRSKTVQIVSCERVESVPVRCITVDSPSHLYLFGRTMLPTHNSFSSAGIGLYMAFADGENGAECYCAATTEAQAGMVFAPAWSMVHMDNDLKEAFGLTLAGTIRNPTSIYRADDLSRMEPIIGTPKDGSSPNCGICDELHEHPSRALYDSLDTGMGARSAPLLIAITTAGINISSFCYELELEAIQILEGTLEKENVFVMIFGIDVDDDWRDFEVWRKANPNLGVSINEEYLLGKYQDAMTNLSQRAILLTKHCNVWANAGAMWCDMNKWNENARPDIKIEQFLGKKATIAIDLASKIDIVAVEIMFELEDMQYKICPRCGEQVLWENETYICSKNNAEGGCSWQRKSSKRTMTFSKFYLPESTVLKKENNHYQLWTNEGLLTVTEGERTDFQKVEEDLQELCKLFIVSEIVFDPKEAAYLIQNIQKWFGGECIECNQSPAMLSEPMKECEAMIVDGCFLHDGNKVLTWMFGNVIRRQGKSGGNVKYAYPSKQSEGLKIDGAVACITGLSRIMTYDTDSGDSYNARAAKGQTEILRVI